MVQDMQSGTLDVASELPSAGYTVLSTSPGIQVCDANPYRDVHDLGFNCYTGAASQGNPVLKDASFRRALNFAIDKEKLVEVAYEGHAVPGSTVIVSDYYEDPDWHWTPPAEEAYTFDLDKARAALDAAGYKDTNGDGIRDYRGEPIVLRFWVLQQPPSRPLAGRLITGWLKDIGLKIKFSLMDEGTLMGYQYNYEGSTFAPDYDLFYWGWGGDMDPNFLLSCFTTSQIEGWSDTAWSNEEYDRLYEQQQTTIDPKARQEIIWKMQEIMYEETPMIFTVQPGTLSAWNTSRWTGWVRSPADTGQAIGLQYIVASYRSVSPVVADETQDGSSYWPWVIGAAVAAGVAVVAIVLLRRRHPAEVDSGE